MKRYCLLSVVLSIFVSMMMGCSAPGAENVFVYGGSEPQGDLIAVSIDYNSNTVTRINYTTGNNDGPFAFTPLSSDNGGFSILRKAELTSSQMGNTYGGYVYFAEFPQIAVAYQLFVYTAADKSSATSYGNPAYAVYRENVDKSSYYEKKYNWMKFFIDDSITNANMDTGFAAWDSSANAGRLFGSSYSHRDEVVNTGDTNKGFSDINSGGTTKIDSFGVDTESLANVAWGGATGNYSNAFSIVGTASGSVVMDFGPEMGGGMGIAIPQSDLSASAIDGTYLLLVYHAQLTNASSAGVEPMKVVISGSGTVMKVFDYDANTGTATPNFEAGIVATADFTAGPLGEGVSTSFQRYSGIANASSTAIADAYLCKGSFLATNGGSVVNMIFEPQTRFLGFTGFFDEGSTTMIRFGFGIKDTNYSDAGL